MMRLLWVLTSLACLVGCGSSSEAEPLPEPAQGGSSAGAASAPGGAGPGGSGVSAGGAAAAGANSGGSGAGDSAGQGGSGAPVGGSGSGSGASGSSAGGGGLSGGGTANGPYPTAPPVRDSASKVPISSAGAGYTVEGNHAYGPLTAQRLDVIYPNDAGPNGTAILPVVLMFHGGAWIHSYTNDYGSGKDHMSTFFSRFLKHGFIVCNAEYRVNDGTAEGAVAPAAVEDALLAAKWCWDYMDYFHGDRSKFVVTGASAGGHLALMVGMTTPAAMLGPTSPADFKVAAIVDGYGPADIEAELNAVAKGWIPTNLPNRAAIAKLVNPITYVSATVPPMIAVTGANDNTAPVRDTQKLVDLLKAAGADASIHLVPGEAHGYTSTANGWNDAEKAMFDWLTARGIGK